MRCRGPPAPPGDEPDDEQRARERGSPFRGRAEAERRAGEAPPPTEREHKPQREECRREEVEAELPRKRVERPERDKRREPCAEARPQRPDRRDGQQLKRNHHERVSGPRWAAPQQRVEREQQHRRRRVLRVGVVAVQERVPPDPVEHSRVDARRAEREIDGDPGDLERERQAEQRTEAEPLLRAPRDEERERGHRGREHDPRRRSLLVRRDLGEQHGDRRTAEREMRLERGECGRARARCGPASSPSAPRASAGGERGRLAHRERDRPERLPVLLAPHDPRDEVQGSLEYLLVDPREVPPEDPDADQLDAAEEEHGREDPHLDLAASTPTSVSARTTKAPSPLRIAIADAEVGGEAQRHVREGDDRLEREPEERGIRRPPPARPPGAAVVDRHLLEPDPRDHAAQEAATFRHAPDGVDHAARHQAEVACLTLVRHARDAPHERVEDPRRADA